MPDDKIKISALPSALSLNNTDEMAVVQESGGSKTTKRSTVQALGSHIAETMNFSSELDTNADSLIGAINEAASDKNLADQYSNLDTYDVGDFVIYKTVLYKCITAVTVPEEFDPTKWTVAKVSDLVGTDMQNYYTKSEVDAIASGKIDKIIKIVDSINWADYGSSVYTLGWRVGQYNYQTGADQASNQLMKVYKLFKADDYNKIVITPPSGYFIQVTEYSNNSAGTANYVSGHRFSTNETAIYNVTKGHYYGISLGWFDSGDSGDYLTEEFISQIVGTFEFEDYFVQQSLGQSEIDTMSQKAITDAFQPYAIELANSQKPEEVKATINLESGNEFELDFGAFIRKNWRLSFSGEISNFNACKLGFNYKSAGLNPLESQAGVVVEITSTKVIVTKRTKPADTIIYTTILDEAHGLTIADYLQVVISGTDTNAGKILLECNGSVYQQDISDVEAEYYYKPFVNASDCDISNGTLAYTCTDFNKQVLIIGDSYTRYVNNRWPYWLHQWGYDKNCIINGHGGAKSMNEGWSSNKNILAIAKPKYAFWCLGMNDGSDTDENTPNANWSDGVEIFLSYCSANNVIPVFGTIPNARNSGGVVLHDGKNKWIRNSGYQYVDFAKSVGADSNGDWRTGLRQGATDLHPSEAGAKVLCMQVLADFPQIMIET